MSTTDWSVAEMQRRHCACRCDNPEISALTVTVAGLPECWGGVVRDFVRTQLKLGFPRIAARCGALGFTQSSKLGIDAGICDGPTPRRRFRTPASRRIRIPSELDAETSRLAPGDKCFCDKIQSAPDCARLGGSRRSTRSASIVVAATREEAARSRRARGAQTWLEFTF